jgi:hypothetical protein
MKANGSGLGEAGFGWVVGAMMRSSVRCAVMAKLAVRTSVFDGQLSDSGCLH